MLPDMCIIGHLSIFLNTSSEIKVPASIISSSNSTSLDRVLPITLLNESLLLTSLLVNSERLNILTSLSPISCLPFIKSRDNVYLPPSFSLISSSWYPRFDRSLPSSSVTFLSVGIDTLTVPFTNILKFFLLDLRLSFSGRSFAFIFFLVFILSPVISSSSVSPLIVVEALMMSSSPSSFDKTIFIGFSRWTPNT